MYNNGYGAASPPLTNNPFLSDTAHPSSRFPDITSPTSDNGSQYTSWLTGGGQNSNPTGYSAQNSYQQNPQYGQAPQLNTGYSQQGSFMGQQQQQPSQPFTPTSSFGQQLAAHVSGSSYGYLNGQPTGVSQQQQQYNPAQQQIQNNPGYVAQFDPYSSLGQVWDNGQQQQQQQQPQQQQQNAYQSQNQNHIQMPSAAPGSGRSASGELHPREYIRTHKAEIESWDSYAWKQLLNTFEALKNSWEGRKTELNGKIGQLQMQMQYGGGGFYQGQIQQEGSRLQGLLKEADLNFDSVAASTFQMQEVFSGYRQSGDLASKRRVREATNAALQSLPDWPQAY
ncbi:hypothetical protein BDQ12DRAFT_680787 [Crucibulum laeve]|uniref:Uncharacterized protein n=1 Tax=Crucibulum laeve TaxID=68775 RepID=A0A5C3M7F4_9AGAR|nr:hypothetical protein BDQ12DRAFT_680787 [Crucibulum laeve]